MNVPTDGSLATSSGGHPHGGGLKIVDVRGGGLDPLFDLLGDALVRQTSPSSPFIIKGVQPQGQIIADRPNFGQPLVLGDKHIDHIPMKDEVLVALPFIPFYVPVQAECEVLHDGDVAKV